MKVVLPGAHNKAAHRFHHQARLIAYLGSRVVLQAAVGEPPRDGNPDSEDQGEDHAELEQESHVKKWWARQNSNL